MAQQVNTSKSQELELDPEYISIWLLLNYF